MSSAFSATMPSVPSVPLNVTVTVRLPELSTLYMAVYPLVSLVLPFFTVTYCVMLAPLATPANSTGSTHWDKVSAMEKTLIFAEEVMVE